MALVVGVVILAVLAVGVLWVASRRGRTSGPVGRRGPDGPQRAPRGAGSGGALGQDPDWLALVDAFRRAEEVAEGRLGDYPFDEAGKASLLGDLEASGARLKRLVRRGLLTSQEAELLRQEIETLRQWASEFRVRREDDEEFVTTCYLVAPPRLRIQAREGKEERLEHRLGILEALAAQGTVSPEVLDLVRRQVEADLAAAREGLVARFQGPTRQVRDLWRRLTGSRPSRSGNRA